MDAMAIRVERTVRGARARACVMSYIALIRFAPLRTVARANNPAWADRQTFWRDQLQLLPTGDV
jgi:hypothetical protein